EETRARAAVVHPGARPAGEVLRQRGGGGGELLLVPRTRDSGGDLTGDRAGDRGRGHSGRDHAGAGEARWRMEDGAHARLVSHPAAAAAVETHGRARHRGKWRAPPPPPPPPPPPAPHRATPAPTVRRPPPRRRPANSPRIPGGATPARATRARPPTAPPRSRAGYANPRDGKPTPKWVAGGRQSEPPWAAQVAGTQFSF